MAALPKRQATLTEMMDKSSFYWDEDTRVKEVFHTIAEQICVDMAPFDYVNKAVHHVST